MWSPVVSRSDVRGLHVVCYETEAEKRRLLFVVGSLLIGYQPTVAPLVRFGAATMIRRYNYQLKDKTQLGL